MKSNAKDAEWEILPPEEKAKRAQVEPMFRWVALVMDGLLRIPGTKIRFGLNPLLDLIPVVGDVSAGFVSASVLFYAIRRGLPKILLARMGVNVLVNELVGIIPGVGSAFAFWFRCNKRNYEMLRSHAAEPREARRGDWIFVFGIVGLIVLVICAGTAVSLLLIHAVLKTLLAPRVG